MKEGRQLNPLSKVTWIFVSGSASGGCGMTRFVPPPVWQWWEEKWVGHTISRGKKILFQTLLPAQPNCAGMKYQVSLMDNEFDICHVECLIRWYNRNKQNSLNDCFHMIWMILQRGQNKTCSNIVSLVCLFCWLFFFLVCGVPILKCSRA